MTNTLNGCPQRQWCTTLTVRLRYNRHEHCWPFKRAVIARRHTHDTSARRALFYHVCQWVSDKQRLIIRPDWLEHVSCLTFSPALSLPNKQVYRRRYESRRSSKHKLHWKQKKIKWRKTIFNIADGIITSCSVSRWWHWCRQVTAPFNVIRGSGMTGHWIRPNVRHIGILHLVSISTTSPPSTCHSAPVSEILSK